MLRIANWEKYYEPNTNPLRPVKKPLPWLKLPTCMDEGYMYLIEHENGGLHFAAWIAMLEIAARRPSQERGKLPKGFGSDPHDIHGICQSLFLISRIPAAYFEGAIPRLLEMGWIEEVEGAPAVATVASPLIPPVRHALPTPPKVRQTVLRPSRFEEFWKRYPKKVNKDAACREWLSFDCEEKADLVFACLLRYERSREVASGAVMNPASSAEKVGWLAMCHADNWTSDWPVSEGAKQAVEQEKRPVLPAGCANCNGQPFVNGARCTCPRGRALKLLDEGRG
jgi:hypothetical protein